MSETVPAATAGLRRLLLALALAAGLPLPAAADANWWNASWTTRRKLTFDNSAQGTSLVGFPVMVRLDSSRVDYAKTQGAGQDIRFVDADNLTLLPHEIETWNESGSSYVWVRVPRIDAGSTTDFVYMYYGNPSAADGQNATAVWDTDFRMVQHLRETSGQHQDSTSNDNDSVAVDVSAQGTAAGRVDGADTFSAASTDNVDVADAASLDPSAGESLTVEAWVRSSSASNTMMAVSKEEDSIAEYQLWVQNGNASFWTNYDPDGFDILEYPARVNSAVNVRDGSWHYLVGRWNGTTKTADLFVDGAAAGTPATNALMVDLASGNPLVIGEEGDSNRGGNFDGDLDEVRVSKTLRSSDWVRAQHLSMTDAFVTFGSEPLHTFTDVTARCGVASTRSPLDKVSQRKVVRDRDGYKYLVFGRFRDTGGCVGYQEVRLARSTDGGATWTEVTLFGQGGLAWSAATESFVYPAIDVSPDGDELHVIVQQASGTRLLYTRNATLASWDQASAWTRANGTRGANSPPTEFEGAEQPHARSILSNTAPAIAVDGDGLPHLSFQAVNGADRNVYWQFWQPGAGAWSGEVQVSEAQSCTSSGRDVSIDFGEGKDGAGTARARVHFLYMKDANCGFGVDTLCYAFAEKTGSETFALTQKACTGSGLPPYDYLYMTNGTGAGRIAKAASIVAHGGGVWAVAGYDNGGGATVEFAYSDTNGDFWPIGAAAGAPLDASASPSALEGYPSVGADLAGHKHRILSGEAVGSSTTRLYGYQWRPRKTFTLDTSVFRFRSLLTLDNAAGETTDYAHVTLEKEKHGADFASCWYVSEEDATPPPATPLLVDEIRCSVEPALLYRSISLGSKAAYSTGTVAATSGGKTVTGTGTAWRTNGWGTGDRLTLDGADYVVAAVTSDTQLSITVPFRGQTGGGKAYTLARQFTAIQTWENCVSGNAAQCPAFPSTTGSLVADNRIEVGLVYDDGGVGAGVTIDGSTTDIAHTITLGAAPGNRHLGNPLAGAYLQPLFPPTVLVKDLNVRVEWLVLRAGGAGGVTEGAIRVDVTDSGFNGPIEVANNIMVNLGNSGIVVGSTESQSVVVDVANNVIAPNSASFQGIRLAPFGNTFNPGSDVYVVDNTAYGTAASGIVSLAAANPAVTLQNNIAWGYGTCFNVASPSSASDYNLSSDASAPGASSRLNVPATGVGGVNFADPGAGPGTHDYHLLSNSVALEAGATLVSLFERDMDSQKRPGGTLWDIGADEYGAPTAVSLMSFVALPGDGAVTVEWRTASEIDHVGFHLHRGPSAQGPWTRITPSLVPGGSASTVGQAYSWLDAGLVNGVPYFYRLEDVDTASRSTFHGPVSATPGAPAPPPGAGEEDDGDDAGDDGAGAGPASSCPAWVLAAVGDPGPVTPACARHGDPDAVSLQVVSRDAGGATLELRTGGFWALREPSGTVRVFVPGLDVPADPAAPALPVRRALVGAAVGKGVRLASAEPHELRAFPGLRPAAVGRPEALVSDDGTVRPSRRALAAPTSPGGYLPRLVARLDGTVFQGEAKSAVVEISPVRFDGRRQQLVLAGLVRVRLAFTGGEGAERGSGSTGRALPRRAASREVLALLHTTRRGLHAVSFEALFAGPPRTIPVSALRLQRQGEAVPFHVEPPGPAFGPGSTLYFFADRTASSTDYSGEVAWELVRSAQGRPMAVVAAPPEGPAPTASRAEVSFETNRIYMPDLTAAPDPWLWQVAISTAAPPPPLDFALAGVDALSPEEARLVVHLQGGSGGTSDHRVEVRLNGVAVGEAVFAGKEPHRLEVPVPVSALREGANQLGLVDVTEPGVTSRVFLDRFSVEYPQTAEARGGSLEGTWAEGGTAEVGGLAGPPVVLALPGDAGPQWLIGAEAEGGSVRFRVEAGRRYLVASAEGLLAPRVAPPSFTTLRSVSNRADYVLVAPRAFLDAARPLLDRRESQGLRTRAASFEEIAEAFGHGQPSAEAIHAFLSYAFHSWSRPSPRYVLLLGDATFDPRRFQPGSWASPLPALWTRTSYLSTASDPLLAAVNGEDALPDLAVGRLPATTRDDAERLVAKVLAWEDSGQGLDGEALLVADNPDSGGDFEADVEDARASFLADRATRVIRVRELGAATRAAIRDAFDEGPSLVSYVGHGGAAVWASENVWSSWDTPSLLAQSRQGVLLTLNCLNGYFVASNHDALAEALLKAGGRGTIAAVSPSGLSLDGPAHQYHRALLAELTRGTHERLGDAVFAAQEAYAQTGLMPELLTIYQLLGDPATKIR